MSALPPSALVLTAFGPKRTIVPASSKLSLLLNSGPLEAVMKAHGLALVTVLLALAMALLAVAAPSARAQNQYGEDNSNPGEFGPSYGAGNWNCRHWLSSPAAEKEGASWILGWWHAANRFDTKNHFVGHNLGGDAILARIRARCEGMPGMALTNAVGMEYSRIGQKSAK